MSFFRGVLYALPISLALWVAIVLALGWQMALVGLLLGAIVSGGLFISSDDGDEWDHVAERKRQIERRARRQSGEFQ